MTIEKTTSQQIDELRLAVQNFKTVCIKEFLNSKFAQGFVAGLLFAALLFALQEQLRPIYSNSERPSPPKDSRETQAHLQFSTHPLPIQVRPASLVSHRDVP